MKIPKYVLRVGGHDFVIANNTGVATLMKLMEDAIPVNAYLSGDHPEIELVWWDKPDMLEYMQQVVCRKIPARTVWTRKTEDGRAEVVTPVGKKPKSLPGQKALPSKKFTRGQQLALGFGS